MYEGIYLIKEREFKKSNEDIYKLGRSFNLNMRIKDYPKRSSLFLIIFCKDCENIEKQLIILLTNKFKIRSDYGAEYFEGDIDKMINEIQNFMKHKYCIFCKVKDCNTDTFIVKDTFSNTNVEYISYPLTKNIVEKNKGYNNDNKIDGIDNNNNGENITNKVQKFVGKSIIHACKICGLTTKKKGTYDEHLLTQKHKRNVKLLKIKINNNTKNDNNSTKINKIDNKIDNLTKQTTEVLKQNEELRKKIEHLEDVNNRNTNNIVKEIKSVKKSVLRILNTDFKDTPSIDYIDEEEFRLELEAEYDRKIDDDSNSLFMRIFNDYNNKKLIKTLSDLILKFIKKEDQKSQSVFILDSARGNYATKVEDIWLNDKCGLQFKKYTLDMVIKYMLNILDIYRLRLEDIIKKKNKTQLERDYITSYQNMYVELKSYLMNTNTHKRVISCMSPELKMNDK
jgi:hypothetical protein